MKTRPATRSERHLAFLWLAAAASAIALRPVWLAVAPYLRPCVFYSLTGIPCPSCGTTHAGVAFLHGDLAAAFAANPLAALAGLIFIVGAPLAAIWAIVRAPVAELRSPLPLWVRVGMLAVIALNWLYLILVS